MAPLPVSSQEMKSEAYPKQAQRPGQGPERLQGGELRGWGWVPGLGLGWLASRPFLRQDVGATLSLAPLSPRVLAGMQRCPAGPVPSRARGLVPEAQAYCEDPQPQAPQCRALLGREA